MSLFQRSRLTVAAIVAITICLFVSTSKAQTAPIKLHGKTMGPIKYNVTVSQYPNEVNAAHLQKTVQTSLDRVNQLMSTYIPDSDVSRFNQSDSTQPIAVERETALVVARALEISTQTQGAFDVTVGPAVDLWNFGPKKRKFTVPADEIVESVKTSIGFQHLSCTLDPPTLQKSISGLKIDLSAIAKGYAVDVVADVLDAQGCDSYLVEVGGEVRARGLNSDGNQWKVGVEYPTKRKSDPVGDLAAVAYLKDRSMATSGDYRNFEMFQGKRYSHTIDPKTCRPVEHSLATACLLAKDCMTADALATAVSVMGVEQGKQICDSLGVEYYLVVRDETDANKLTSIVSKNFPVVRSKIPVAQEPANGADRVPAANGESIWPAFIAATTVFGLAILAMAVGSIFANKPVTGSCGGLANMTNEEGDEACGICAKPTTDCVERVQDEIASG